MSSLLRREVVLAVAIAGLGAVVVLATRPAPSPPAAPAPAPPTPGAPLTPAATARPTPASPPPSQGPTLRVPRAAAAPVINGELDDPAWLAGPARAGALTAAAGTAPYADARLLWRDATLYVALYAADEDIRAPRTGADAPVWLDDHFHLAFDGGGFERSLDVSPRGVLTDGRRALAPGAAGAPDAGAFDYAWQSGAVLAVALDGTLDAGGEADEEWVVELAIPLAALDLAPPTAGALASTDLEVRRCDTPPGAPRVCATWRGRVELAP